MTRCNSRLNAPDAMYEIWLSNTHGFFERGVAHMTDGRTLELRHWMHVASYGRDSVLVDDEEHHTLARYPLRWLVEDKALDFYGVDSETPDVIFHNETGTELRIDKFGVIPHGISVVVSPQKLQEVEK